MKQFEQARKDEDDDDETKYNIQGYYPLIPSSHLPKYFLTTRPPDVHVLTLIMQLLP